MEPSTLPCRTSPSCRVGDDVDSFEWAPDSSRLAYRADQDTINVKELYSSRPDGTDNMKISGDLVPGGNVTNTYEWVP